MAKKFTTTELQSKSISELQRIKKELQKIKPKPKKSSNRQLQFMSVEQPQRLKKGLVSKPKPSKRKPQPISQPKYSDSKLRSMSIEDLQNLKKDLISKPFDVRDKEFLINIKDSLEEYMKIYLPNEYANLNKFQQNDYTTTSGTREPVNCTDIYAINYNQAAEDDDGSCCYDNACLEEQGLPGIYGVNLYGDLPDPYFGELDGLVNVLDVITLVSYILGDGAPEYYIPPYHEGDDSIEYPDIYIRGTSDATTVPPSTFRIIHLSYPFGDDFKNANFKDVLTNSLYELDGETPKDPTMWDQVNINYSPDGINKYLITLQYVGEWVPAYDDEGIFTEDNGYKIPEGAGLFMVLAQSGIIKWTL